MKLNRKLMAALAAVLFMLGASTASAGLMKVNVTTSGLIGSKGGWELSGPTPNSALWHHLGPQSQNWSFAASSGDYLFKIGGIAGGFIGNVSWSLSSQGQSLYSNNAGVFLVRVFGDKAEFTKVPEPGSLALLGGGLLALGLYRRRRQAA